MNSTMDCRFCIDGNMPAGSDPDLGELYETCPVCRPACPGCDGLAVFPAAYDCQACFIDALNARGLGPMICPDCTGVISLVDLHTTEETP